MPPRSFSNNRQQRVEEPEGRDAQLIRIKRVTDYLIDHEAHLRTAIHDRKMDATNRAQETVDKERVELFAAIEELTQRPEQSPPPPQVVFNSNQRALVREILELVEQAQDGGPNSKDRIVAGLKALGSSIEAQDPTPALDVPLYKPKKYTKMWRRDVLPEGDIERVEARLPEQPEGFWDLPNAQSFVLPSERDARNDELARFDQQRDGMVRQRVELARQEAELKERGAAVLAREQAAQAEAGDGGVAGKPGKRPPSTELLNKPKRARIDAGNVSNS